VQQGKLGFGETPYLELEVVGYLYCRVAMLLGSSFEPESHLILGRSVGYSYLLERLMYLVS
jgi:hypothetical protein